MSRRTEKAYVGWIRRFILFHAKRHPSSMGAEEITRFLSILATEHHVSASTQNQALAALLFLYRIVLGQEVAWLDDLVRARRPQHIPVVMSRREVELVLRELRGMPQLMGVLLYGAGIRLLECAQLRVKDVDFERSQLVIRAGKGDRDRLSVLPAAAREPLRRHLERVERVSWSRLCPLRGRPAKHRALVTRLPLPNPRLQRPAVTRSVEGSGAKNGTRDWHGGR